jgi:PKD repeat protein
MESRAVRRGSERFLPLRIAAFVALTLTLAGAAPATAQTATTTQSTSTQSITAQSTSTQSSTITQSSTTQSATRQSTTTQSTTTQTGGIRIMFSGSYSGAAGEPITFSAQVDTSGLPAGTPVQIEWDFGDGATATGATVTHTYDAPGTYTVTLTVTAPGQRSTLSTVATIDGTARPGAQQTGATMRVDLTAGCTNLVLTWPDGTPISTVLTALSNSGVLNAIWWLDAAARRFRGYSPVPGAPNDLTTVNRLQTVFICLTAPATLTRPAG